jgi:hypothetical protein
VLPPAVSAAGGFSGAKRNGLDTIQIAWYHSNGSFCHGQDRMFLNYQERNKMEYSDHILDLDDILLFDPFTLSGQEKLDNLGIEITPGDFFESFYCEPFFC